MKELLKEQGLTIKRAHEITGIPVRTIEEWSRGAVRSAPWVIPLLAFYLRHREEVGK